ncbi:glutamine synthetase [Hypoxylon argillaceum]|nr:glutamine synthetase [Hypoxylon argillaceum]
MTTPITLTLLDSVVDNTPIIDHHGHPLLDLKSSQNHELLGITTEAGPEAHGDCQYSFAHIRAVKQLAEILGCDDSWGTVESKLKEQRGTNYGEWIRECLRGIDTILVDDGLGNPSELIKCSSHDEFITGKCKRIVRIETLAADFILQCLPVSKVDVSNAEVRKMLQAVRSRFTQEIQRCLADPEVAGFKSILCYRGGLDILSWDADNDQNDVVDCFEQLVSRHLDNSRPFQRLSHRPLNHLFIHLTAQAITQTSGIPKPLQFHTGLGDNDITLSRASPSHLQPFIRDYPRVPIVLLHASYPWTREAGYLATVYPNVYADIGLVFPQLSRRGQEGVVLQILELCPWNKILWSTDGHYFPETYLLATIQMKSVFKTVLAELVRSGDISEKQAVQLVQDILFFNPKKLYGLETTTTPPSFSQLSQVAKPSPASLSNKSMVLSRLQNLGVRYLRVYWHDYSSAAKCRLVPIRFVSDTVSASSNGEFDISITKAALGLLPVDALIPQVVATGEYILRADWSSLKPGPAAGHASCFGSFLESDGSEAVLCPRSTLRKVVQLAAVGGLEFLLGFEIEFVVLERSPDADGPEKYRKLRNDGHSWSTARPLAEWGNQTSFATAADDILTALDEAGIAVRQFHAEGAPGQYELVLPPLPPVESCDTLLHARQVIESVAARYGYRVTLHPRPFADSFGSASHVHLSIVSPGGDSRDVYERFYGGILKHFRAIIAFTYSHPASYERMVDSIWAGGRRPAWGTQNKETPLRKCKDSHWEVKVLDGLANPYLAIASLLAAGTSGHPLTWGDCAVDPAHLSAREREDLGIVERFPTSLKEALRALNGDEVMTEMLGEEVVRRYTNVKEAEMVFLEAMAPVEQRIWVMERY